MLFVAILIACGGGEPAGPGADPAAAVPEPPHRLNVAKSEVQVSYGPRSVNVDFLLTGDPTLFGTYVDAGEVWVDPSLGGMVIDSQGKVVAKPDITQQVRSVGLRGLGAAHVLEERPDPNSEGNVLKRVRAVGKYAGCEATAGGTGATVCWVDVGDPPPSARSDEKRDVFTPGYTTVRGYKPTPAADGATDAAAPPPKAP